MKFFVTSIALTAAISTVSAESVFTCTAPVEDMPSRSFCLEYTNVPSMLEGIMKQSCASELNGTLGTACEKTPYSGFCLPENSEETPFGMYMHFYGITDKDFQEIKDECTSEGGKWINR